MCTALYSFQALSAALYARRNEPRGRYIASSLLEAAASVQVVRMMATWLEGGQMSMPLVPSGIFRTGDGWLQLSILREPQRSEEHTSELQSLMRISYAVFCLKKKKQ